MKIYQQNSPELRAAFQKEVDRKVDQRRQNNEVKGSMGEGFIAGVLTTLPDSWGMFHSALIPGTSGKLTEIDILLIGPGGIFVIEVKNWRGSYSAYRDNWKRRDGQNWIDISNSPTSQNLYHRNSFQKWLYKQFKSGPYPKITAPAIFPSARWVNTTDCSVPVLTDPKELLDLITQSTHCITGEQCRDIINRIAQLGVKESSKTTAKLILRKKSNKEYILDIFAKEQRKRYGKKTECIKLISRRTSNKEYILDIFAKEQRKRCGKKTGDGSNSREQGSNWQEESRKRAAEIDKRRHEEKQRIIAHFAQREKETRETAAAIDKRRHEERQRIIAHFAQKDRQ
ncbi:MAG: NERD domain-containing protein [Roseofilum sp. SID2]|uniref:nuclease-related domain-containing protein n=1 Tax=unclassified Roseofilum TaxID=2620099 RepID=UPI001B215AB6|nr:MULTISPECIES: nuclease-related domain-containing protein [unclassified Roseofilum]MBP0011781.1 NERD domain-containing protein [Roseofilum sp. SID3]MBP0023895.1 NERD domain-containing protein [Roseofilum sp. SID2]